MANSTTTDLMQIVIAAAGQPKKAEVDGQAAEVHSLAEMIEAARFQQSQAAAAGPRHGIRFTRLIPPGTVMDNY